MKKIFAEGFPESITVKPANKTRPIVFKRNHKARGVRYEADLRDIIGPVGPPTSETAKRRQQ